MGADHLTRVMLFFAGLFTPLDLRWSVDSIVARDHARKATAVVLKKSDDAHNSSSSSSRGGGGGSFKSNFFKASKAAAKLDAIAAVLQPFAALPKDQSRKPTTIASLGTFALVTIMSSMYWQNGYLKTADSWNSKGNYSAVMITLNAQQFTAPLGYWVRQFPNLCSLLTFATVLTEKHGPTALLLIPAVVQSSTVAAVTRVVVALAFVGFHLGLFFTMELGHFPYICCSLWLLVLPPHVWDASTNANWDLVPTAINKVPLWLQDRAAAAYNFRAVFSDHNVNKYLQVAEQQSTTKSTKQSKSKQTAVTAHEARPSSRAAAPALWWRSTATTGTCATMFVALNCCTVSWVWPNSPRSPGYNPSGHPSSVLTDALKGTIYTDYFPPWAERAAEALVHIPRLDHIWPVFTPYPESLSWRLTMPAMLRIDVETGVPEPTLNLFALRGPIDRNAIIQAHSAESTTDPWFPKFQEPFRFPSVRWLAMFNSLARSESMGDSLKHRQLLQYGRYVCRKWNGVGPSNTDDKMQLMSFNIEMHSVYFDYNENHHGSEKDEKTSLLWRHKCFLNTTT
eukprot:gene1650-29899_t